MGDKRKNPPIGELMSGQPGGGPGRGRRKDIREFLESEPEAWKSTEEIAKHLVSLGHPEKIGNKSLESAIRADLNCMFQDAVWHLEPDLKHNWRFNPDFGLIKDIEAGGDAAEVQKKAGTRRKPKPRRGSNPESAPF